MYIISSTLPRGERPYLRLKLIQFINFNPRSREGSDGSFGMFPGDFGDFNPRSREGSDGSREI